MAIKKFSLFLNQFSHQWLAKNATQNAPKCWKIHHKEFQFSKISRGACPRTPLEGRVAEQPQFTSATYLVQIRHLLHFLMTTLSLNTFVTICLSSVSYMYIKSKSRLQNKRRLNIDVRGVSEKFHHIIRSNLIYSSCNCRKFNVFVREFPQVVTHN